jgi:hypothetical protein
MLRIGIFASDTDRTSDSVRASDFGRCFGEAIEMPISLILLKMEATST